VRQKAQQQQIADRLELVVDPRVSPGNDPGELVDQVADAPVCSR
jgi:hypothetical protein